MHNRVKELINSNDRFAIHNGMRLIEVREGYAVSQMEIDEKHLNAAGVVQGGAIFSLADLAFGAASNSEGILNLSLTANITFVKPASKGTLRAYAKRISKNRKTSVYQIEVKDEEDNLIATVQGVAYSKEKYIP
ncbi:PaaI family thioesterase [Hippea sp. KM1]|uniref:PaaI family thioesterase n=1 Tax=Hippea sp. KM1 TaxID=944481 RepID=UPI00046D2C40|nr:PaaI family thioesterase [Hippea sp. KM1]